MQPTCWPTCQDDSKVGKNLRLKVNGKIEIISKIIQIHENDGGSAHGPVNKKLCQRLIYQKSFLKQTKYMRLLIKMGMILKALSKIAKML